MAYKVFGTETLTSSDVNTYLMRQAMIVCTSSTRPSSPVTGMHIWETDTQQEYYYSGSAWVFGKEPSLFARKTADETVNNSTTMQDDDHLSIALKAQSTYMIEVMLIVNTSSVARIQVGWNYPGDATFDWFSHWPLLTTNTDKDSVGIWMERKSGSSVILGVGYGADVVFHTREIMIRTLTAGNMGLRWAQGVAEASDTKIKANSFVSWRKVA